MEGATVPPQVQQQFLPQQPPQLSPPSPSHHQYEQSTLPLGLSKRTWIIIAAVVVASAGGYYYYANYHNKSGGGGVTNSVSSGSHKNKSFMDGLAKSVASTAGEGSEA